MVRWFISKWKNQKKWVTYPYLQGTMGEQKMADLPKLHVEPAPPFTYCGKQSSTYRGSRFPPTDSFKHWEDSSVEERGPVQEIHCNRGTNFTSAETELNRAIEEMDDKKIKADLLKANIAYIKNPVSASQFRGIWERQIRSIRNIMNSLMKEHGDCFIKYPWGRSCVKLSPQSTTGPGLWKHSMTLFWDCLYHQVFCWQERQGLCCLQLESLREKTLTVARNRDAHSI